MRKTLLLTIVLSLLIFGCNTQPNNNDSKEKELLEKEIELLKKEKELLKNEKSENEINQPLVDKDENKKEQINIDRNYLLLDKAVGKFKIGSSIPFPEISDDYKINKETQTRMTEEGPEEETVYIVLKDGKEIMQLKPEYDYNSGQYTQKIGEILLTSSFVKTLEGVGVGSTIEDFIIQYPDYKFWYTYVSGMYVLESNNINGQFILNEKDFVGKLNITSDMITLKKSDFNEGSEILKIRVI